MRTVYTSDSHLGHTNIINFCRRPFADTETMNTRLIGGLRAAEEMGCRIIHGGDIGMNLSVIHERYGVIFKSTKDKWLISGNHDRPRNPTWRMEADKEFSMVVGTDKEWETNNLIVKDDLDGREVTVMVSHNPQEKLPDWVDFNVYGHVHNNLLHGMSWHLQNYGQVWCEWLATSERHLNASVELTGYVPAPLGSLIQVNQDFRKELQAILPPH